LIGLFLLGRQFRRGREGTHLGLALSFAWASFPYFLYTLESNPNDALVGALLVFTLLALSSPIGRSALLGVATMVKFGPAALVPLLARGREAKSKSMLVFMLVFSPPCVPRSHFPSFPLWRLRRIRRVFGIKPSVPATSLVALQHLGSPPIVQGGVARRKGGSHSLSLIVAVSVPRRRSTVQVAAFSAAILVAVQMAATYWFYLYIVWFALLVLFALFTRHGTVTGKSGPDELEWLETDGLPNVPGKFVDWERSPALARTA
jgi:hypothetical protein